MAKRQKVVSKNKYESLNQRSFFAARQGRMEDLETTTSINAELRGSLELLRGRCRQLAQNEPLISKAINLWRNHVIGTGIDLYPQVRKNNGDLDTQINRAISDLWKQFLKYGVSTVDGTIGFVELCKLIIESITRDGEFLAIKRKGAKYGQGFQLELIPIEQLNSSFTSIATNGNLIFQSIEIDSKLRPVAYWLAPENPTTNFFDQTYVTPTIRIPAEDVIHLFQKHYVGQVRGFPWIVNSVLPLHHLNQYRISELEMARVASLKQLYFTAPASPDGLADDDVARMGQINLDLFPGSAEILPLGVTPEIVDFNSPNNGLPEFAKVITKSIASGLSLSYSSIANDLESINFSSAKYASLEDAATYQNIQSWFINSFLDRIYETWVEQNVLNNNLKVPLSKLNKLGSIKWIARGQKSVNLSETARAYTDLYNLGVVSLTQISQELLGLSFEETILQKSEENDLMEEWGITLNINVNRDKVQNDIELSQNQEL